MTFSEILNKYTDEIKCTNKDLAQASGISPDTISRYKKGLRVPTESKEQISKISHGIAVLSQKANIPLSEEEIFESFSKASDNIFNIEYETYIAKLKKLLEEMRIGNSKLAKSLNFDPSYISKILAGKRRPSDIHKFTNELSDFIARNIQTTQIPILAEMIDCSQEEIARRGKCAEKITQWLISDIPVKNTNYLNKFLVNLDEFNLNEYIKVINFDKIKIVTIPFIPITSKKYNGLDEMMTSELDFIRITLLSKSQEDVIAYSSMPMEEMAKDNDFPKKWMLGTAMMLKKGLHLHMIHNIDRPLNEMMLGLESYIPMYMTGQISPYYLKNNDSEIFLNHIKVSGAAALSGEAIRGYHNDGRYFLTTGKEDLKYYRNRAQQLLSKAYPLMKIYNQTKKEDFWEYFNQIFNYQNIRKIFSSLPVFTISDELLEQIMSENLIHELHVKKIKEFIQFYRKKMDYFMQSGIITFELPEITLQEFERKPLSMAFSELFFETDIRYTYEEYRLHLEQTKEYANKYNNFNIKMNNCPSFRNIDITIIKDKSVIVSKSKSPAIHFMIEHPKMIEAFEKFIVPISD